MSRRSSTTSTTSPNPGLERNVLSIPNGIALAASAMAPVLAVVLNAPAAAPVAGAALPLSFLVAFIGCAFVGNTVVQFSRKIHSSGSFYTFNSQGLGTSAGFFTGWLFWIGYAILAPGLFTAFGAFTHDYAAATFHTDIPWWVFSLAAMAMVFALSARSIKASVQVDLTLLAVEVVIFLTLAVIAVARAGEGNSITYFAPSASPNAWSGVGLGAVFGILSFIGFDAAATLGEETRNPRRSVPIAVGVALAAVGAFYVFVMYALTAGYNLKDASQYQAFVADAHPFVTLAWRYTPWLVQPVELAAIAGIFSCFLAVHNTTVRVMYAMGRDQILPTALGRAHHAWSSPFNAIIAQSFFTVVVGIGTGLWLGPGATGAYGFTGAIGTVAIVIVYIGSNVALIRYYWRSPERRTLPHIVLPSLGVIVLGYPLYVVAQPGQAYPYNLVPIVVGVWLILGAGVLLYFRATAPAKIRALGNFISEDSSPLGIK